MNERVKQTDSISQVRNSRQINVVLRHPEQIPMHLPMEEDSAFSNKLHQIQGIFSEMIKELDRMVGMDHVKDLIYEIYALQQIGQYRAQAGLKADAQVYHMVFKGNPGTGKTTVARILARLFQSMNVLSKGHLIEVERADLVGEYIGHTALKTRELVKKALGGILFIDEAYSLARGGEKDFGREAIDCLVKSMEDYKNQFVLILAGYPEEMDYFLLMNPGLPSRFPIQLEFTDYSVDQLMQIAELMIKERQYVFAPQAEVKIRQHLTLEKLRRIEGFSNARFVRNLLEQAIRQQAVRLLHQTMAVPTKQDLMLIRTDDLRWDKKKTTV